MPEVRCRSLGLAARFRCAEVCSNRHTSPHASNSDPCACLFCPRSDLAKSEDDKTTTPLVHLRGHLQDHRGSIAAAVPSLCLPNLMSSEPDAQDAPTTNASIEGPGHVAALLGADTGNSKTATPWSHTILLYLIAFRLLNALTIRTFFQPDEYFQSLEPAWQMSFGADSGAWITWVSISRAGPAAAS